MLLTAPSAPAAAVAHSVGDRSSDSSRYGVLSELPGTVPPRARISLHPGRAPLGGVDLRRLQLQFDLSRARAFASLAAAELALEERPGFLVEITGSFADAEGRPCGDLVLYVDGLRA